MRNKMIFFILVVTLLVIVGKTLSIFKSVLANNTSGRNEMKVNLTDLEQISQNKWVELAQKRIFFGHQSVGNNIIKGFKFIMANSKITNLNIQESSNPNDYTLPIFGHARIGNNCDPISKIKDFSKIMNNMIGEKVMVAGFKFCYVDFNADTDIMNIFSHYLETMEALKIKYPKVIFIHFTVPVTKLPNDIVSKVKRLLKIAIQEDNNNYKRNEFNNLLRDKYRKEGTLFDLAAIESTSPNGIESNLVVNGIKIPSLLPNYTEDGGHLDEYGRVVVAKKMLEFLLSL